jgi:hypothetical protein
VYFYLKLPESKLMARQKRQKTLFKNNKVSCREKNSFIVHYRHAHAVNTQIDV